MKYLCESCVNFPCTKDMNMLALSCPVYSPKPKPITNYDCLHEWSEEEIAEFTIGIMDGAFKLFTGAKMPDEKRREMKEEWLDWLRQEVSDGES